MTPIMSLAVLAIFAMMIPLLSMSNQNRTTTSQAEEPTPSPEAEMWMESY